MSGRRRKSSAGTPTATVAGAVGILSALEHLIHLPRHLAKQNGQSVFGLPQTDFQIRYQGLGGMQEGAGLRYVQFGYIPALEPCLGDLQRAFLDFDVLAGDVKPLFQGADRDIGACHLGGQGDQDIIVRGDGRFQAADVGLDPPAEFAPEIELPGGIKADVVITVGRFREERWPCSRSG